MRWQLTATKSIVEAITTNSGQNFLYKSKNVHLGTSAFKIEAIPCLHHNLGCIGGNLSPGKRKAPGKDSAAAAFNPNL